MNLIPESRSGKTFDYFCTWSAQTRWGLPKEVNLGPQEMRDRLTEDFLFGEGGLLRGIDPTARGGLIAVLDDGRITDSQGRTVDFKNTVIILTSNLGSDIILNDLEQRRANGSNELSDDAKHQIDLLLKSKFRPEFLNRLDEIVYYKSLTKDEMRKIVDLQLADLRSRMDEGKHLNLDVTTAAKDYIIDSAYDSVYGARPIKRFIQSRVETLIAKAIIQGRYAEGSTLTVDYDGNALVLK